MNRIWATAAAAALTLLGGGGLSASDTPRFEQYPALGAFTGRNAAPDLSTEDAQMYRTRIAQTARMKPNFAGHYIIGTWGCGTGCSRGVIVNAVTGKVVFLPESEQVGFLCHPPDPDPVDIAAVDFRTDSRLLIVNQVTKEYVIRSDYFIFDGARLMHLKTISRPQCAR